MATNMTFSIAGSLADSEAFKQRIIEEATKRGLSASEYVVEAIADYMRKEAGVQ